MQIEILTTIGLGFMLGLKHALDADHLIAVTTIISNQKSLRSSSLAGTVWGIGHTMSLLFIGLMVIFLQIHISEVVALTLESCVALMLIMLGIQNLWKLYRGELPHVHGKKGHKHSLLVGIVHGMAGSAALMLLILATIQSSNLQLLYIMIFGLGSIIGMTMMSTLIGLPFVLAMNKSIRTHALIRGVAGTSSVVFGLFLFCYLLQ